jgi:hypothetical protein
MCSNPVKPDGAACNDGNACTQTDTCQAGTCSGTTVQCTALDQCHAAGTCDPATGRCSNPVSVDGTACNDGNACTQTDTCRAGVCMGVNYSWSGVLQPVNADGSSIFNLGRTISVKFKLTGLCAGNATLTAKIFLTKISDAVLGTEIEATATSAADTNNTFRYEATSDQYIYNLSTKSLSGGTWQIRIAQYQGNTELATIGTVNISLKK